MPTMSYKLCQLHLMNTVYVVSFSLVLTFVSACCLFILSFSSVHAPVFNGMAPCGMNGGGGGGFGGGGFFLACEDLGRLFDHSFPACAFFFVCFI